WQAGGPGVTHTVLFHRNDGSGNLHDAAFVVDGDDVAAPAIPTRVGFAFLHWSEALDGEAITFPAAVTGDMNLHAAWQALTGHRVNFWLNDGTATLHAAEFVDDGSTVVPPANPTRTGYTFRGWYTDATAQTALTRFNFGTPIMDDLELYARWTVGENDTHTVLFWRNDGSGNLHYAAFVVDGEQVLPPANPTRADYTFGGWHTHETATDANAFSFGTEITADLDLYARWTAGNGTEVYTVLFWRNDGSGALHAAAFVPAGSTVTPPTSPTRADYTFRGWYAETATTTRFNFGTPVTGDLDLYARWTEGENDTHTVLFWRNDGSGNLHYAAFIVDGEQVAAPTAPTRTGFTFRFWSETPTGAAFTLPATVNGDMELYAIWQTATGGGGGGPMPTPTPTPVYEEHQAYMFGTGGDSFRPTASLTRAEAATILARTQLLEFNHSPNRLPAGMTSFNAFSDVNPGQWHYYYIAWAYNAGLVRGYDGEFRPNDPVTRQELAAMIVRSGITLQTAGNIGFGDADTASNWARNYLYTVYREGLMVGDQHGNFRPLANISRAETATAMNRLLGRIDSREALGDADVLHLYRANEFSDVATGAWYFPSVLAAANDHRLARDEDEVIVWIYFLTR
ncbi:MAG: InlB B-repeat-containing protein, partial [Oscillospiraceae bacterium]|nr:InlB B-repeat-containing protein [Oscillospiraceae bacterium]